MHVVHIITRLIVGGAQENTLLTVEDQQQLHGDRVTLITGPGLGPEGSLEPRALAAGVDLRLVPEFRRNLHPWRDWSSYRTLIRLLQEIRPEIVHTHSSKAGILGRRAANKLGIPVVHTIHGAAFHYGQKWYAKSLYRWLERQAGPGTAKFISVADAMTDQYVAAGVAPREKFVTISSGFDVEPFLNPPRSRETVRRELGIADDEVVIGKVGRLFPLKGHEFVIAAAGEVLQRNPRVRFLFVGDGILRGEFESQLNAAGLRDRFVFTGLVPPTQIPELLHAMDIVVHTSVWEGLARVLPQGLIAGKPVVSYDVDGAREVVIPGETGFLLPPQSIPELVDALCELAADSALRERLGAAGRARFTDQFRHQTMTRRIREVYAEVLGKTGMSNDEVGMSKGRL
ncbi:glycosyltransferase family 4 protein [Planctellipticum variicoloris]|uniref:glycosyltransferase family 4 protein n=1 Tax=Planctellipticum variicoloris TaxID=3064265 RepID=UPI003014060E|nr:glycosyltransferase family 4 protein [Planctomycetaceae bacterium SH412]